MQPGATRFLSAKGATRLAIFRTGQIRTFSVRFLMKVAPFAPKRSKKSIISEKARPGATCK
ncbi:hypothetical protein [Pseudomonas plecoglossicida]|uniref:hypothetical protein n=1 Tax=Pseudomonas plecoglossicida TaxID=70775 RepID=UPI0015E08DFB|nr:hypothetical protein [Pseudomonas plecoglossicida]